jgi:hypothetical protein
MAAKRKSSGGISVGGDPRKSGGSNSWLSIGPNSYADVTALVEVEDIVACEQCAIWLEEGNSPVWVYSGADDPSHDLKIDRRYRAFLPVLVEGEVKVWPMGKGAHGQLLDIADAGGRLQGMDLRIKRTGSGLGTRYNVVPRGSRTDIDRFDEVDVISMLGPLDLDGIQDLIAERLGKESYEDVLDSYKGKSLPRKSEKVKEKTVAAPKGRHEKSNADEEEEEDLDALELV